MKTAIQLLREKWYNGILLLEKDFDEFEEMEKQQIIDAATHGANYENSPFANAEQYYNETFKQ
jgi:hypothetical protein